jgi:hypothetical protein
VPKTLSDPKASPSTEACPRCGTKGVALKRVESGVRLRLQGEGVGELPEMMCASCMQTLRSQMVELKEEHRGNMWKSRMKLVKQAKVFVQQKQFSEAAVLYEKYLRVLELVYDRSPGELKPDLFRTDNRKSELSVIAGVYWDLLNIYDTSNRYGDRQAKVALKLAEFARFTPLFPSIARQAEKKTKNSKNPEAFYLFLKESNAKRPRCFIATSAFVDPDDITIQKLCAFRENFLRPNLAGRLFIRLYEFTSPSIARILDRLPALKPIVRTFLQLLTLQMPRKDFYLRRNFEIMQNPLERPAFPIES